MMHSRILGTAIVAILSWAYVTQRAQGQPQKIEYVNAEMERLERYYGLWSVTERHFDERGQSVGVVKGPPVSWPASSCTTHESRRACATSCRLWLPRPC